MDNNSPLYLAHLNDRKADNHIKHNRFEEALLCHQRASELLEHAMTLTESTNALESLKLQLEYHKKQKKIVNVKRYYLIKLKETVFRRKKEALKEKMSDKKSIEVLPDKHKELQVEISRAMKEVNSFLNQLSLQSNNCNNCESPETPPASPACLLPGTNAAKSDPTVVEKLQDLHMQMGTLIAKLFSQLAENEHEMELIRAKLRQKENDEFDWVSIQKVSEDFYLK